MAKLLAILALLVVCNLASGQEVVRAQACIEQSCSDSSNELNWRYGDSARYGKLTIGYNKEGTVTLTVTGSGDYLGSSYTVTTNLALGENSAANCQKSGTGPQTFSNLPLSSCGFQAEYDVTQVVRTNILRVRQQFGDGAVRVTGCRDITITLILKPTNPEGEAKPRPPSTPIELSQCSKYKHKLVALSARECNDFSINVTADGYNPSDGIGFQLLDCVTHYQTGTANGRPVYSSLGSEPVGSMQIIQNGQFVEQQYLTCSEIVPGTLYSVQWHRVFPRSYTDPNFILNHTLQPKVECTVCLCSTKTRRGLPSCPPDRKF